MLPLDFSMHGVSVLHDKQGAVQFKPFLDNWNWKLLGQTMHVYQVAFSES